MGRANKLGEIAYELKNLWNSLSRQELCDYYGVTDRTLYNWQKILNLPKNTNEAKAVTNPITVYVQKEDSKTYGKTIFKDWDHISNWFKAQKYPVIIDTLVRNDKKHVVCKFNKKALKADALKLEKELMKK